MMRSQPWLLLVLSIFGPYSPVYPALAAPDNAGRDFVFAFGANTNTGGSLEVYVLTQKEYAVSFNYTRNGAVEVGVVSPGQLFSYTILDSARMSLLHDIIETKAQFIHGEDELVVYASNKREFSVDAFTLMPTDVLGTEYVIPAWYTTTENEGSMLVIASYIDGTTIRIEQNGVVIKSNFTLDYGEVYQWLGNNLDDDITGAKVISDNKVSVMSGCVRCSVLPKKISDSSDHLVDAVPPINTLGREFITSYLIERSTDAFRIIAVEDNVDVVVKNAKRGGGLGLTDYYTLPLTGDFVTITSTGTEYFHINCTGAVILAQYARTGSADKSEADPMLVLLSSVEQYSNRYTFTTPVSVTGSYRNYLNIVIKSRWVNGLLLDGNSMTNLPTYTDLGYTEGDVVTQLCWVQNDWMAVSRSGYSARAVALLHGTYFLTNTDARAGIHAIVYGFTDEESYGYPAAARYANIGDYCVTSDPSPNDGEDNDCDGMIDEELPNGVDDDGDGLIDEDTAVNEFFFLTTTSTSAVTTTTTLPTTTTAEATTTSKATTTEVTTTIIEATTTPTSEPPTTSATKMTTSTTNPSPTSTATTTSVDTTTMPQTATTIEKVTSTMPTTTASPKMNTTPRHTTTTQSDTTSTYNPTTTNAATATSSFTTMESRSTTEAAKVLEKGEATSSLFAADNSGASPKTNRSVAIGAGVPAGLLALAAILSLIVLLALRARKKKKPQEESDEPQSSDDGALDSSDESACTPGIPCEGVLTSSSRNIATPSQIGTISFQTAAAIVSKRASLRLLKPKRILVSEMNENATNTNSLSANDMHYQEKRPHSEESLGQERPHSEESLGQAAANRMRAKLRLLRDRKASVLIPY